MLATALSVMYVQSSISASPSQSTNENHMIFYRTFEEPILRTHTLYEAQYTTLALCNTMAIGSEPGSPTYPVYPMTILLPSGKQIKSIDVHPGALQQVNTAAQQIDLLSHPITPYQPSIPFGTPAPDSITYNDHVYGSSAYVPDRYFTSSDIEYCRGYAIVSLSLFPTKYNPKDGELFYADTIIIDITLEDATSQNGMLRDNELDEQWVKSLVCNPEETSSYTTDKGDTFEYPGGLCDPSESYDYVVITKEFLTDYTGTYTWADFINRKQSDGLATIIVSVEDILACTDYYNSTSLFNDTPARIREFLRDAYQDWGISYVLIAGDVTDGPGDTDIQRRLMSSGAESNVEAELYWSNLDSTFNDDGDGSWGEEGDNGFDLYSELFIGSVPCDEGIDLSNWMTKCFYYDDSNEKDYLENAAFYGGDTGWSCEGDDFIDFTIYGTDHYYGPYQVSVWPSVMGFVQGFDTWNASNPGYEYNISVRWTEEPPNVGWQGGYGQGVPGLLNAINSDNCTILNGIAHADASMSLDVYASSWEADYHNTKPFFIHDYGCHCGEMSGADDGVLHSMLFHSDTELAFACVYNTGYGWGNFDESNSSSAWQQKLFWEYCFNFSNSGSIDNWQLAKAHAFGKDKLAVAIDWEDTFRENIQCSTLFGDPAQLLKIPYVPDHDILVRNLEIPSIIAHSDPQTVSAMVRNIGNNTETNIVVDFKIDNVVIDTTTIASLSRMESTTVSFPWNPDIGTYLVAIESQPIPDEFDLENNQVNRTVSVVASPIIVVDPLTLSYMLPTEATDDDTFTITNLPAAEGACEYSISYAGNLGGSWISASPDTGTVSIGGATIVTVTVDSTGLDQGTYTGYVIITSNDVDDPEVIVSIEMTVVYGNDMKAVSLNYPTGVILSGPYTVNATVQNLGYYPQTGVVVNCSIFEGGIGGVILDEDFSTNPTDWTITHVSGTAWTWDSYDQRMEHTYGYPNAGYLDSPILDCSGKTGISLSFWHYWKADYSSEQQDGYVRGSIDGGMTFPYLIDEFHHNDPGEETAVKYYDISAWANGQSDVMIRFDIYNYNDWYWRIDDFNVSAEITGPLVYYAETLIDIGQYASQNVQFSPAWNPGMGVYGVQITTLLPTDENPSNDVVADVVSVEGPGLAYTPNSYDFGTMLVGTTGATNFNIWNDGVGTLSYALSESASWVTLSTYSGTSSGEHDPITVTVDTTGLTSGVLYQCDISITSDGGSGVFHVDVLVVDSTTPMLDVEQTLYDRGFPIRHATDGDWAGAQSFTPTMSAISGAEVYLRKFGTPEFDLTIELRKDSPTGTLYDTITIPTSEVGTSYSWLWCDFADTPVTAGTKYFVVIPPAPSGVTTSYGYEWAYAFGNQYDGGAFWFTRNGGGLWRDLGTMYEYAFKTYGLL